MAGAAITGDACPGCRGNPQNMDNVIFAPKDRQGKITIILTDKTGKEKIREASMLQKGPDKKLYRYTKPESQAGIATLIAP